MAFSGTFDYTLDAKNRLTVPAKFRTSLTDAVVLAKGTEQCMTIWPKRDFEAFVTGTLEGLHPLHPSGTRSSASSSPTRSTPSWTPPAASWSRRRSCSTRR
jgi:MraZ protein